MASGVPWLVDGTLDVSSHHLSGQEVPGIGQALTLCRIHFWGGCTPKMCAPKLKNSQSHQSVLRDILNECSSPCIELNWQRVETSVRLPRPVEDVLS